MRNKCMSSCVDRVNPHNNIILYSMADENYHELPVKLASWAISEASANDHLAKYARLI